MSRESWESYVNTDSHFCYDKSSQQIHENGNELWNLTGMTLPQIHNNIRLADIQKRNQDVVRKIKHFYFSRNVVILVGLSIVLGLLTSTFSVDGLLFWNILFAIIVWGFYEIATRTAVRAQWREIWDEIDTF